MSSDRCDPIKRVDCISTPSSVYTTSEHIPTNSDNASHITSAESHIQQVIDNMYDSKSNDELIPCPEVSILQFILCQHQNTLIPKNRQSITY